MVGNVVGRVVVEVGRVVVEVVAFVKIATTGSTGTMKLMVHAVALTVNGVILVQVPFFNRYGAMLLLGREHEYGSVVKVFAVAFEAITSV